MSSDEVEDVVVVEEYDRLMNYVHDLQRIDFFENNEFPEELTEAQRKKLQKIRLRKENTILTDGYYSDSDDEVGVENQNKPPSTQPISTMEINEHEKPIDVINYKLSKLNSMFDGLSAIAYDEALLYKEPNFKKREELERKKQHENRQLNLFAGMYSLKSVIYKDKTKVPPPISLRIELSEPTNTPKLAETYEFSGLLEAASKITPLPYDNNIDDVLSKVISSIKILNRQPYYKKFLEEVLFHDLMKRTIVNVFWWCFLERYQKTPHLQNDLFKRVSETYVALTYLELDPRYKETFFKKLADYLSISVYTVFATCFPDSVLIQFNDEFKEYICGICYIWIFGCKPTPRSFYKWNFEKLDPESVIRTKGLLNNSDTPRGRQTGESFANSHNRTSTNKSQLTDSSYSRSYFSLNQRQNDDDRQSNLRISVLPVNSHPLVSSHELQNSLFNINGHSPLVDCYLYHHNSRKIDKADILVQHATVVGFPPLNAPTYNDVIRSSLRTVKKIEKNLKQAQSRQEIDMTKMKHERLRYMKNFKKNQELLLSKPEQCTILSELIQMSKKKDPYTVNFGLDAALNKAFKKSGAKELNL